MRNFILGLLINLVRSRSPPSDSSSESDVSSDSDSEEPATRQPPRKRPEIDVDEDEDTETATTSESQVRTKNELVEIDIKVPDILEVDPHEQLEKVGHVFSVVDKVAIIKGISSPIANRGSEKALDSETLLVFEDRKVLGYVSEALFCSTAPC